MHLSECEKFYGKSWKSLLDCFSIFEYMQSDLKYKDKQAHQERCKVVYERTHFHVAILILNKTKQI